MRNYTYPADDHALVVRQRNRFKNGAWPDRRPRHEFLSSRTGTIHHEPLRGVPCLASLALNPPSTTQTAFSGVSEHGVLSMPVLLGGGQHQRNKYGGDYGPDTFADLDDDSPSTTPERGLAACCLVH